MKETIKQHKKDSFLNGYIFGMGMMFFLVALLFLIFGFKFGKAENSDLILMGIIGMIICLFARINELLDRK